MSALLDINAFTNPLGGRRRAMTRTVVSGTPTTPPPTTPPSGGGTVGYPVGDGSGTGYGIGSGGTGSGGTAPSGGTVGGSGSSGGGSSSSGGSSHTSGGGYDVDVDMPPPPDVSELLQTYRQARKAFNPNKYVQALDEAMGYIQSAGFNQASNAAAGYASRMAQMGVNPVASDVVEASARMPVYGAIADIEKDKEQIKLDAKSKSMDIRAQIAQALAAIRGSYTATLADFNLREAGLDMQNYQFQSTYDQHQAEIDAAAAAASGRTNPGPGGGYAVPSGSAAYNPGYIPTSGPVQGTNLVRNFPLMRNPTNNVDMYDISPEVGVAWPYPWGPGVPA